MTSNYLAENVEHDIPSQTLKNIFNCKAQLFLTPICVVSNSFVGSSDPKL